MALYRPSALVDEISGTLAGANFSRSPGSPVLRSAQRKATLTSARQLAQRARFAALTTSWLSSGSDHAEAWRTNADLLPVRDRLGQQRTLSPVANFMRWNLPDDPLLSGPLPFPPFALRTPPIETFRVRVQPGVVADIFLDSLAPFSLTSLLVDMWITYGPAPPARPPSWRRIYAQPITSTAINLQTSIFAIWPSPLQGSNGPVSWNMRITLRRLSYLPSPPVSFSATADTLTRRWPDDF